MAITEKEITKQNFRSFFEQIKPYLSGSGTASTGFTPVGTIISVMATTAPEFYLKCDGTVYNIVDYPELAKHFEDNFGSKNYFGGDGTTTFAVPDLRGEFLRGTGTNSHENQGSGANVGTHQDATEHILLSGGDPHIGMCKFGSDMATAQVNTDSFGGTIAATKYVNATAGTNQYKQTYTSRPTNTSVLYCIAYKNIYISLDDNRPVQAAFDRWLRFDPMNKKGLIIKAGTHILKANGQYKSFLYDTAIDFSTTLTSTENGKDFFVYLNDDDSIACYSAKQMVGRMIGRFHTLCADAGVNLTMKAPESPNSGILSGQKYLVKAYKPEVDPDFYSFYNKTITAVSAGTPYDVITCEHPLKGYTVGDILPESVFCLTFYPDCLYDDAMVYDKNTDICVDVYLQSGTGHSTRSAFGATHTVSRQAGNHQADMQTVGKRLLSDGEFSSIALGSNECTNIAGSADKTTVGGHVDTAGNRMISAIGVEEACGYLWQYLSDIAPNGGSGWITVDGRASFGQEYGEPYVLGAGGGWTNGASCGSRSRRSDARHSSVGDGYGGRGCTSIVRSANAPKSDVNLQDVYSLEERIVGRWVDGKPIYQKTITFNSPVFDSNRQYYYELTGLSIDFGYIVGGVHIGSDYVSRSLDVLDQYKVTTYGLQTYLSPVPNTIYLQSSDGTAINRTFYITIQYTKTTD